MLNKIITAAIGAAIGSTVTGLGIYAMQPKETRDALNQSALNTAKSAADAVTGTAKSAASKVTGLFTKTEEAKAA